MSIEVDDLEQVYERAVAYGAEILERRVGRRHPQRGPLHLPGWPAAINRHAWRQEPYIAPTLDLNVAFHRPTTKQEWLLCEGTAPVSTGGLFGWTARLWSTDGALHVSGGGQCKYRRLKT